ncbi:XisI protein [Roseofilum sp. Guam]|uniref:XisI protein n=1 Tax=Roseofilum sp. Guam TaxID=2821502 RepID=UPI001B2EE490|nr:XisI protein [Roseofilum sp. Guam]MBP0029711.1 XisI protein [Roseofilum sp. Guam]
MERINYSDLIQEILSRHQPNNGNNSTEIQLLFDVQRHHYQVVHIGWQQQHRVYGVIIHVDIKGGKIWVQRDGTEIGIANELVEAGVPHSDIVLGFHAPYKREFTDFAKS